MRLDCQEGNVSVTRIEDAGERVLYDITVDDPSGLFYSNGILSHNSTTFCARQLIYAKLFPGYKSLLVTPYDSQRSTYGDRLKAMEQAVRYDAGKQNKYTKMYDNGSEIRLQYALESADRIRGISTQEVLVDECQNMNPDLVPEILKTQSQSKSPMTIYSGTALDTSTLLEMMWQKSSFGCYHVRSWDGKHWINMHDEEELWKVCDNPTGPIDYWTGKPLNVINGLFVHGNQKALEAGDIGIHIPMPVVLSNCSGTQWAQIYKDLKQQDPKKTLQESFGIAIGDGAKEISQADLERCCVLKDSREELIQKTRNGYYSLVVMGCDWGGSDYNKATNTKLSYTAITIMGLAPDGVIDIIWSKKYAGMDYRSIVGDFLQQYHTFNCKAIASDFGVGAVYNLLIRDQIPWQNHFVMQYTAPNTAPFKSAANSELANHYTVNKTEAITNVFQSVKDQKFRFLNWNDAAYYLTDFLNVNRVPYETPSGAKSLRWIRMADKADDYLHACTFASTLIKVYTGERIVTDKSLLSQIRDALAGRPMFDINDWEPPVISG